MKKIMFNDKYGLTKTVLEGRKIMTRRNISETILEQAESYRREYYEATLDALPEEEALLEFSPFKVGEVVAVAQKYKDIMPYLADSFRRPSPNYMMDKPGYNNKMFVMADLMPHQIRITKVRVERLQDISDEDCIKEGIIEDAPGLQYSFPTEIGYCEQYPFDTPRFAFASLIDKVSGKGTWASNPWVYVYEFELVK